MEYLSLGLFTGAFSPNENKRYSFKARGAAAAVELAQLVYNGVSTIFFKSSEGYTDIRDNYMKWTFHAPKDFKLSANSDTALNCEYLAANTDLSILDFFYLLAVATEYDGAGAKGVEVAGWESAMRTLQLAEDRINETLGQFNGLRISSITGTQFYYKYSGLYDFDRFEAPSGTTNLFSKFISWLSDTLTDEHMDADSWKANKFLAGDNKRLGIVLEFERNGYTQAQMTFTFADYVE